MGVGANGLEFALLAKRRGACFDRTIMLGRQNHYLNSYWVKVLFERFGYPMDETEAAQVVAEPYAEELVRKLGGALIDSMDASDYEGASIIHDLNKPLPAHLVGRYTCVIEYGTLEHVFNFSEALRSATSLIAVGGTFISMTPCNNMMGHGFYQFSPELYFNYLSKNGFDAIEIYVTPFRWPSKLFRVSNPIDVGGRVELQSSEAWQMGVIARKVEHKEDVVTPIQSDYQTKFWQQQNTDRRVIYSEVDPKLAAALAKLKKHVAEISNWPEMLSDDFVSGVENKLHYHLVDPTLD